MCNPVYSAVSLLHLGRADNAMVRNAIPNIHRLLSDPIHQNTISFQMDQPKVNIKVQCPGLQRKIEVNLSEDLERYGQLNLAITQGQRGVIESLLERGAPVNRYPTFYELRTPLHSAVLLGDLEIVRKLLSKGASVNARYSYETPLTLAAKYRKYDITDSLLVAKGLKNYSNDDGITHFHIACMRNQVDVAKKLLKSNQVINAVVNSESDYWPGFTPLHFAVQYQCSETVEFLLSAGADITVEDVRSFTPLHLADMVRNEQIIDMILLNHEKVFANPTSLKGLSHFHIACTRNNPKIFKHFTRLGVNLQNPIPAKREHPHERKTALDLAIFYECIDIVRLILHSGFQKGISLSEESALIREAYSTGNMEIVNLLTTNLPTTERLIPKLNKKPTVIERLPTFFGSFDKSDIEITYKLQSQTYLALNSPVTPTGCTVLHLSIAHGNQEVSKYLLARGVNFTIQDNQGKSPLHLAFEKNMEDLVDLTLNYHQYFDKNATDKEGLSHLHIACARGNSRIVKYFLQLGADVNSFVNSDALFWSGFTPLHFAAKFGCERVARILLDHGANFSAINASNLSAFDLAFVEANRFQRDGAFGIMELIITSQSCYKDNRFNDRGVSPLHLVSIKDVFNYSFKELSKILEARPKDINKAIHKMNCSWDGYTPLHFAVQCLPKEDHALMLIRMGADVLKQATNGDTPLHLLRAGTGRTILIRVTIDPPDSRLLELNHIGTKGFSIFHQACARSDVRLMKYFLEHGVDPNCPTLDFGLGCHNRSPLHLVILDDSDSSVEAVKLLLDYDADPNVVDYQKNSPLHLVSHERHGESIEYLVGNGAEVNALNALHETPLMSICRKTDLDVDDNDGIVRAFLMNGADINIVDKNDESPLSVFSWSEDGPVRYPYVIETLLTHVAVLKTADLFVSQKNQDVYLSLVRDHGEELEFVEDDIIKQCKKELDAMKQIYLDNHTTLHSILYMNSNKLILKSQNPVFQQIVDSDDFYDKFHNYSSILEILLEEGQTRRNLLNESREPFSSLLSFPLPRLCVEEILRNLENRDLENVIKSREEF